MVGAADETIQSIVSNDERPEPKPRAGECSQMRDDPHRVRVVGTP